MEWTGKITTGAYVKIHSLLNSYKRIVAIIFLDDFFFFLNCQILCGKYKAS